MSFFQYAASRGPLVISRSGKVYLASSDGTYSRERLEIRGNGTRSVIPLLSVDLDSLWNVYHDENREAIERRISSGMKEFLCQDGKGDIRLPESFSDADSSLLPLLYTVLFDVGPFFTRHERHPEMIEGEDSGDSYVDELEKHLDVKGDYNPDVVSGTLKRVMAADPGRFSRFAARRIGDVLRGVDYLIRWDGRYYSPRKGRLREILTSYMGDLPDVLATRADVTLRIGISKAQCERTEREDFEFGLDRILQEYAEIAITSEIAARIPEDSFLTGENARRIGIVLAVLEKKECVDFGTWGMLPRSDGFTVYLNLPQFGLRDWQTGGKHYYLLPESRVGVRVYKNGKSSAPFMLSKLRHPFVSDGTICMGTWRVPEGNVSHRIIASLDDAKKVLTSGLTPRFGNTFDRLSRYPKMRARRSYLRLKGIPVTNEGVGDDHAE
ncbi:MAG: hypothetical protein HYW25_03785 [Candidatus Aenigmarchaeota archaeon]|nr:hypothetical protein [Candidatus Aenigmarchaeota archaeon]